MFITTKNRRFEYHTPQAHISDIAQALGAIPRYLGHTCNPFSVAQHSVVCLQLAKERGLSKKHQFTALMHDAAEAYCGDLPRPLKETLPDYKAVVHRVEKALAKQYGYAYPYPKPVQRVDRDVYRYERRGVSWSKNVPHHAAKSPPPASVQHLLSRFWTFEEARTAFINAFEEFRSTPDLDFILTPQSPYPTSCTEESLKTQTTASSSPAVSQAEKTTL